MPSKKQPVSDGITKASPESGGVIWAEIPETINEETVTIVCEVK